MLCKHVYLYCLYRYLSVKFVCNTKLVRNVLFINLNSKYQHSFVTFIEHIYPIEFIGPTEEVSINSSNEF